MTSTTTTRSSKCAGIFVGFLAVICLNACEKKEPEAKGGEGEQTSTIFDPDIIEPAHPSLWTKHEFDGEIGKWYENNLCCDWSAAVSDEQKRAGSHSLKFELRKTDKQFDYRSQLGRAPHKNQEEWYGFSLFFPESFVRDRIRDNVMQWQARPDLTEGEGWRSAPLFLGVDNDSLFLEIKTDSARITNPASITYAKVKLGAVKKAGWQDWVFHIKWSGKSDGILEVWKDGVQVVKRINKPNCYNDDYFPYMKIGLGKWEWASATDSGVKTRILYVDEVKVGRANAGYEDVAPGR